MSNRDIVSELSVLRSKLGRQAFKMNLKKAIAARSNLLEDYFQTKMTTFLNTDGQKISLPLTSLIDINVIVSLICEKRGLDGNEVVVILGVNGGQHKLIITLAICPSYEKPKTERQKEASIKNRYKSTSTHRVVIGARVDNIPECYYNLKVMLDKLKLNEINQDFKIVCDLKVVDILLGIQSTSSTHCCPYCHGHKVDKNGQATNKRGIWVKGPPQTINSLLESCMKWVTETGENRKLLKSYFNVEYPPIFIRKGEENVEVWLLYPPPQLHTGILGPANDVFKNIEKVVDISDFKKKYSIKGKGLGGDLQGPTLKGIMKDETKLKELEDIISHNDENIVH